MRKIVEIHNHFQPAKDASNLLYTPADHGMTYRETRRYSFQYSGSDSALLDFVQSVLVDPVSEDLHDGPSPCFKDYIFHLDLMLKPSLLDLEKEYIRNYVRDQAYTDWTLDELSVAHRYYFFGKGDITPQRIARDMVNPVIHTWNIVYGTGTA